MNIVRVAEFLTAAWIVLIDMENILLKVVERFPLELNSHEDRHKDPNKTVITQTSPQSRDLVLFQVEREIVSLFFTSLSIEYYQTIDTNLSDTISLNLKKMMGR